MTEPADGDQELVPVPGPDGPTTARLVADWLQLAEVPPGMARSVAATNRLVRRWLTEPEGPWPADFTQGTTMLAGRMWRRRNSPGGLETMGDMGPVYVRRSDPDVAMLLGLGEYTPPRVG